jgi:hypothetical protein
MATKIKDLATAEKAALNLNKGLEVPAPSEPNAPREKGTTERLFPDFMTSDGGIVNRPVDQNPAPVLATDTLVPAPQTQTPQTKAPTTPVYIKPEDMAGKMAKLKVDGVEQDVPAEDLFKVKQLERHSISQLEMLAKERAQFERERQEFLARQTVTKEPEKKEPPVKVTPEMERIAALEAQIKQLNDSTLPARQEAAIKQIEKMAKDKLGTDDFRSYFDKIRDIAVTEGLKARAAGDVNAVQFFDSPQFYYQQYQEMKLRDLMTKPPASQVPATQAQQGAPVLVNNEGKPVSIPTFESSSGVPSSPSEQGNWQSTYNTLLSRAKADPTDLNWMAVMRHKFREGQQ